MRIKETVIEIPADHDRIPADHDRMTLELIITDEGVILNTTTPRDWGTKEQWTDRQKMAVAMVYYLMESLMILCPESGESTEEQ